MEETEKKKREFDENSDKLENVSGGSRQLNKCPSCGGDIRFVQTALSHYYECGRCRKRI